MNSKIRDEHTDRLFQAILLLKDLDECYNFFEDICTISELKAMAQRLEVAKMLREGCTYTDISEKTGASTATISRVNRSLNYGADGYKTILERLEGK
ncbi:MAG: YerC/YecD family TrpR-related protein [Clostridia bacterium]|nr:YerC/YecD family TrpR-related protein [Clostridia bacterium]